MIVFNNHLVFKNEKQLWKKSKRENVNSIVIQKQIDLSMLETFSLKTKWAFMSGKQVRYLSKNPLNKDNRNVSWAFEIKDVVILIWDAKKQAIFYMEKKQYTPQQLQFWIYHTFFPIVLELKRTYRILHVGSVEIKGKPVAFSAQSFGGKSTLTDYFLKHGHTLLSDDSLGIEKRGDGYYAIASYPFHRPYREVETLGYYTENFSMKPKPLHVIYTLEKVDPDVEIQIVELKGIEKFKVFHYSSFIDFDFMKKERFEFFTEMAKHVPVYKITIPWDLQRLPEVYDAIVKHSGKL